MSTTETTSEHSTASVADVRGVINTDLDESAVLAKLEDAWYDAHRANDYDAMDDIDIKMLEKYYASYLIRGFRDRSIASGSRQSVDLDYDGSALDELRSRVNDLDPSGDLAGQPGVTRRVSSHVGSVRPHSRDDIGSRDRLHDHDHRTDREK